jgi:hypothetical protein
VGRPGGEEMKKDHGHDEGYEGPSMRKNQRHAPERKERAVTEK